MKIGFDVSQTGKTKAGCGYVSYSLAQALSEIDPVNQYLLYPTFGDSFYDPDWAKDALVINAPNFERGLAHPRRETASAFWRNPPADFEEKLGSPDIIHSHSFYCPIGLKKARLIYTLHDLAYIEHPEWTTELNRVICFSGVFRAVLYADFIVSISEYTRQNFLKYFPYFPEDRIQTFPLGSRFTDASPVPCPPGLQWLPPKKFWLNASTLEPRKNQAGLLEAYASYRHQIADPYPLVIAGGKGWMMDDFQQRVERMGLSGSVHLLGYVSEAALLWLYQNCFAFVFPTLFEGFGLTPLEAMSQGAVVITSNTTSIPEVVGDAGILVEPTDMNSIMQKMLNTQNGVYDLPAIREKSKERVKVYSWKSSAKTILQIYEQVMSMNRREGPDIVGQLAQQIIARE
jgi:glycosyltransferase involved in cell wall biosynthesis